MHNMEMRHILYMLYGTSYLDMRYSEFMWETYMRGRQNEANNKRILIIL